MPAHTELGVSRISERILESIPGLLSWGFMFGIIVLSYFAIDVAAAIVVGFSILWLFRIFGYSRRLVGGYRLMKILTHIKWHERLGDLHDPSASLEQTDREINDPDTKKLRRSALIRYREVLAHAQNRDDILDPDEVIHAVMISSYNETQDVIEPTVQSVVNSDYDTKQHVILVMAYEERGGPETERIANEMVAKYGDKFLEAWAIKHPDNIPGEAKAKAGNITYSAKRVTQYMSENGIDPGRVLITTLDSDNRPSRDYFAYLTYIYCISEDRTKKSYQPMAMFFNNIWDAPALTRVIATSNSFWLLMEAMRPQRLRNFSAHAQSLQTLIDTNYWNVRSIVEDGHQYWRTYFTYDGQHTVVPIYTSIYQDAVLADGYFKTFKAQFKQLQRWAYGASDTPFVLVNAWRDRKIPVQKKLVQVFRQLEGYFSWATAPIVLAVGGWIPLLVNAFATSDITAHLLPSLVSFIQTASLVGLLGPIIASIKSMPPRPKRYSPFRSVLMVFQWFLIPVTMITFGSFAALNSQTRLMFGRYLESFTVTEKKRLDKPTEATDF